MSAEHPERTDEARYVVIDGRRWRATDPQIPEPRRGQLQRVLMAWRRDVRRTRGTGEEARSRAGVQAAKVALGERGIPWWEQATPSDGRGGRPRYRCPTGSTPIAERSTTPAGRQVAQVTQTGKIRRTGKPRQVTHPGQFT